MEVIVFTDNTSVKKFFSVPGKSKNISLKILPAAELKGESCAGGYGSLIYYDLSGLTPAGVKSTLNRLKKYNRPYGIIDPGGLVNDPADLIISGASDYIGKPLLKEAVRAARFKKVLDFRCCTVDADGPQNAAEKYRCPLSGSDWKGVKSGKEYTFCFMFIELDNQKELKKAFHGPTLERFTGMLKESIEKAVTPSLGKIWMWMDLGGLVLFPFDGEGCPAILEAFRLMLNRKIISYEDFDAEILLSYRIAVHIGDTVYHSRGETGEIVSDSINSIFHLGQKFADPGGMYLTEDARGYIPQGLERSFLPAGKYEGREIFRLRGLV